MASIAKFDTWQDSAGKSLYGASAYVNLNGTGTVAIRLSKNVSSITDLGVGSYRVNYSTTFSSSNLATVASCNNMVSNSNFGINVHGQNSASVSLYCVESGGPTDKAEIAVVTFS